MNVDELGNYVAGLRLEFATAYEVQRAACERAVVLMRRLMLAEALLETFTAAPPLLDGELTTPERPALVQSPPPRVNPDHRHRTTGKPRGRRPAIPWEVLAAVWTDALAEGRSPHKAVAALATERGVAMSTAKNWPKRLREYGLIPQVGETTPVESAELTATEPTLIEPARSTARPAKPKAEPEKPAPRFPAPSTSMEWDLPERRRDGEEAPEMPRRATPRAHALSGIAL